MWLSQPESFFLNGNRKVSIERNFLAPNIDSPITATITIWKSSTISHRYNYPEILSTTLVNSKKKCSRDPIKKILDEKKRKWSKVSESDEKTGKTDQLIKLFLQLRAEAKESKDYELSDKIRDQLIKAGIVIKDNKEGTVYSIKE